MKVRLLDILYGTVIFGVAAFLYWYAVDTGISARRVASDPMWYPKVILVLLGLCSAILVVRGLFIRINTSASGRLEWRPMAVTLLVSGGALLLYERFGFLLVSLLVIPLLSWLLGFRRPIVLALITAGFTVVVWVGFRFGLGIRLPAGTLFALGG
ncbi:MAG: tripartite tricarboxylate transporter TctB family protein [Ectothiorhodospiraceae bacterium]|nr:tripartite tricarboxylate transporter TctB family protein [Ectothiorhodospiraceae bacterium]MCH8503455.1 tripartite tricarboxylate transporter TctB family protein [Ectothiorhodospiraceae bacterium]